jgi:peptidylprolyl isomerase domain and WD repeat-containing protein 1
MCAVCVRVCCVSQAKKTRVLEDEPLHMARLPSCELYELSYMHRDEITHHVMAATDFYITASKDGFVKFWKKNETGIEFAKVFRAHMGTC